MDDEPSVQEAINFNVAVVERFLRANNVPTTYDEVSLKWLEQYILDNRATFSPEEAENMVNLVGAFLGECVRRTYGGQWVETDKGIAIEVEGIHGFPFGNVARVVGGEKYKSIVSFFRGLPTVVEHSKQSRRAEKRDDE